MVEQFFIGASYSIVGTKLARSNPNKHHKLDYLVFGQDATSNEMDDIHKHNVFYSRSVLGLSLCVSWLIGV
jgi:hypothetical protein